MMIIIMIIVIIIMINKDYFGINVFMTLHCITKNKIQRSKINKNNYMSIFIFSAFMAQSNDYEYFGILSTFVAQSSNYEHFQGSKLGGARTPAAPSNFCREPKYVLFDIHNIFMKLMKMQLGSLEKILISSPDFGI